MRNLFRFLFLMIFVLFSFSVSFWFWRNLLGIKFITREQWWANDKYLFADFDKYKEIILNQKKYLEKLKRNPQAYRKYLEKQAREKTKQRFLLNNWRNEIKADKVIQKIDGKKLWWWIGYKYDKTKIIIHHTATNYDKLKNIEDVKNLIRWIYYYQAIKRWWWDIWYNFLIWPFWNIYEWRFGWESVVWANSKRNNVPSIWIALIWNFNEQKPTKAQIKSLIELVTVLSEKYHIAPMKKVIYHEDGVWKYANKPPYLMNVIGYALAGHKDTGHTLCPWKYLYRLLPMIREKVEENLKKIKKELKEKITKNQNKKKISFVVYKGKEKKLNLSLKFWLYPQIYVKIQNVKFTFCKSLSKGIWVTCSWNNLKIEDIIKKPIVFRQVSINTKTKDWINYTINFKAVFLDDLRLIIKNKVEKEFKLNAHKIRKITHKIYYNDLKREYKNPVKVLLYDLSLFRHYNISCSKICIIQTDKWTFTAKSFQIDKLNNLLLWIWKKAINVNKVTINPVWWFVKFDNYNRKSYAGIPWNYFRWKILIYKDYFKPIWRPEKYQYVVVNELSLNDYLKWIAEWNDQMSFEKLKVMALLAKDYILFYLDKKNKHPSIPLNAKYNAIDDPRIFQKYVGAWFEKTSKVWWKALQQTKNEVILYNGYVPILPYFSCSKWFTFSARQKFWRIDTPYLQNAPDLGKCNRFYGHWVGLSWKWAEILAKKWLNYKQILQWYFPGVKVVKIDFSK